MKSAVKDDSDKTPVEDFIEDPAALVASISNKGLNAGILPCASTDLKTCLRDPDKHESKHVRIVGPLHNITTTYDVPPYSEIYGHHPSVLIANHTGFKLLSRRADPYTGKLGDVVKERMSKLRMQQNKMAI